MIFFPLKAKKMFLSTIFENRKHYLTKSPLSFEDIQRSGGFLAQIFN